MSKCSVLTCPNRFIRDENGIMKVPDGMSFHRFPANEDAAREWADALGFSSYRKFDLVCSAHFRPSDYVLNSRKRMLHGKAVPMLAADQINTIEDPIHIAPTQYRQSYTKDDLQFEEVLTHPTANPGTSKVLIDIPAINASSPIARVSPHSPRRSIKKTSSSNARFSQNQCRVCSFESAANLELFEENGTIKQSGRDLFDILHVNISPGDGYPTQICRPCNTQLKVCVAFQQAALETHAFNTSQIKGQSEASTEKAINRSPGNISIDKVSGSNSDAALYNDVFVKDEWHLESNGDEYEAPETEFLDAEFLDEAMPLNDSYTAVVEEIIVEEKPPDLDRCQKCHQPVDDEEFHQCVKRLKACRDCLRCGRKFRSEHVAANHKCEEWLGSKACANCNEVFDRRDAYLQHTYQCGAKRLRGGQFKGRKRDEKPLEMVMCTVCSKQIAKRQLAVHMCRHSDERPYQCPHCPKKYKINHELKTHMTTHTNERRYVCEICGNAYRYRHHLLDHKRSKHSNFQISCPYTDCTAAFKRPQSIQNHLRVVHGQTNLRCPICDMPMRDQSRMKKHLAMHARRGIKAPEAETFCEVSDEIEEAVSSLA